MLRKENQKLLNELREKDSISNKKLLEQYRKNSAQLNKYYEPSKSKEFNIGKKDTNIGASVSKPFSKIDKRNLNSEIGLSFTKGDEKGGVTFEGTKRGKAKNLSISFSKTFKKGGLNKWFSENWVDIGAPKKNGQFQKCGRGSSEGTKRKYPKCVPL